MSVKCVMTIDTVKGNNINLKRFTVEGTTYCPEGDVFEDEQKSNSLGNPSASNSSLKWISMISSMCNESKLMYTIKGGNTHWSITGEPTEGALKVLAEKLKFPEDSKSTSNSTDILKRYNAADK